MMINYESERLLAEYLLFHYGAAEEVIAKHLTYADVMKKCLRFPQRTVAYFKEETVAQGLDLGCAVGGSSFEMAKFCGSVTAVDYSHAFIHAANQLKQGDTIPYLRHDEADSFTPLLAALPHDYEPLRQRVTFLQGNAMDLPSHLGSFDCVHAANLLCRLTQPELLLQRLPALVKPKGNLVITTPCTWLEACTPASSWPKGSTLDWLKEHLLKDFTLTQVAEEPFLIRETARKYQLSQAQVSLWQRI